MSRELKFRAWFEKGSKKHNLTLKKSFMEYDVVIDNNEVLSIEAGRDIQDRYDVPIMQYTGLKDKNGKEIYEGDIVRVYDTNYKLGYVDYTIENLEYFYILKFVDQLTIDFDSCEVIGNIHENPELLENKK